MCVSTCRTLNESKGCLWFFVSIPFQRLTPRDISMTDHMLIVCEEEVANLLKKGVIKEITDGSDGFLCSVFCVQKKQKGRW